jgi:hypothetical protein
MGWIWTVVVDEDIIAYCSMRWAGRHWEVWFVVEC